jgi:hypothetical protein
MIKRLRNLWAWSKISPYEAGAQTGQSIVEAIKEYIAPQKAEIVYPNKVVEVLKENPNAELDELITR